MPSEASGRYPPGPGTDTLLGEGIYQEIRLAVANRSPKEPDSLATESLSHLGNRAPSLLPSKNLANATALGPRRTNTWPKSTKLQNYSRVLARLESASEPC